MSYNIEGIQKHLETAAEILDEYKVSMMFLQETKVHHHEEANISNKLGVKRPFWLNSPDLYTDNFTERLEMTKREPVHGTGIILDKDEAGGSPEVYESTGHRFQHVRLAGANYINVYMPTRDTRIEGKEKLEQAFSDLNNILRPLKGEPVAIIGDMNLSEKHDQWRKNLFRDFFKEHELTLHSPAAPTNYPRGKGEPATLDHMAATKHFSRVVVRVLDRTKVPMNASTHVPVVWSFSLREFESEKVETEAKVTSKKMPRPDWRFGIDMELWEKTEKIYVEVAMDLTRELETTWRVKTLEYILAKASAKARMVPLDTEEVRNKSRKWFGDRIKDLAMKIKSKKAGLAGEFSNYVQAEDLADMFPEKGTVIVEMEEELLLMKQQMNMELHRALHEEAERDSDQLMVTMRSNDSSKFHKTAVVNKVILSETPKLIRHKGKTYTGNEVLRAFAESAAEQSGEIVNVPGNSVSSDYVSKKETVMMKQQIAKYDGTYFVDLTKEKYNRVLSLLPNNKSPDIYGLSSEHLKHSSEETNEHMRQLINEILSDITRFSDFWISLSLAVYIHKGKNRDPTIMKSYRRIQIGCLVQKFIQRLVEDQITDSVKSHEVSTQWGFSRNISFLQCPVTRECLTKLSIEKQIPLYCVAADVQSAFSRTIEWFNYLNVKDKVNLVNYSCSQLVSSLILM